MLIPPLPHAAADIACGDAAGPPRLEAGVIHLPAAFTPGRDRAYWDLPIPKLPSGATTLLIDLACSNPGTVRAVSLHLPAGAGWYSAEAAAPATTNRQTLVFPRGSFAAVDSPAAWHRARSLRLSLWKRADQPVTATLHGVAARRDTVAIVRGGDATAPGEEAFARRMAERAGALLMRAGIPYTVIDDTLDEELNTFRLLLLPWSPMPDKRRCQRLVRFVRDGGKLLVFYNASSPLAAALGLTVDAWQGAPAERAWTGWTNAPAAAALPPLLVPHRTTNLLPPRPVPGNPREARTLAVWTDASGRATDLPACVVSTRGAWFAHVPPLATASAGDFMRQVVFRLLPDAGAAWAAAAARSVAASPLADAQAQARFESRLVEALAANAPDRVARLAADHRAAHAAARLAAVPPTTGEIRAVWETGGRRRHQLTPLFAALATRGINTVFYHMQSGGRSHLMSDDNPLLPSEAEVLEAARRHRVDVHAWITCWSLDSIPPAERETLAAAGRLMRDANGNALPWLCPSHPVNQERVIEGAIALARAGLPGIHLDYIRYTEAGCYAAATRTAFEAEQGAPVADWPAAVLPGGPLAEAFGRFRQQEIARVVARLASAVRAVNPRIILSAAVFPDPATARSLGQEWSAWLRDASIDFVCPMAYTENLATFSAWLDACLQAEPGAAPRIVAGLGTGADESQLDSLGVAEQIAAVRARRLRGFACFAVDSELLGRTLPPLPLTTQPP